MRRTYKPEFYDQFRCTADRCSFNCCQQWEIGVDEETLVRWEQLDLRDQKLTAEVIQENGRNRIRLNDEKNCPFLEKSGLCRLVREYGEDMLSETCATFPRQIHRYADHRECSLMPACPEVVDLLYQTEKFEVPRENQRMADVEINKALAVRDKLLEIVQDESYPLSVVWLTAFYVLLQVRETSLSELSAEEIHDWEYGVVADHIGQMEFDLEETLAERNELLLDVMDNYRKQEIYTDYLDGLAEWAESLEEMELSEEEWENWWVCPAKTERFFRNYLCNEVYINACHPEEDLDEMILAVEWMGLTYACIRHAVDLKRLEQKEDYESIREAVVILSRVMGYSRDDIKEYLEASFESPIWDWGYMALLIPGNGR